MLNPTQFSGGPNPGTLLIKGIDKALSMAEDRNRRNRRNRYQRFGAIDTAKIHQQHNERAIKPVTLHEEPQMETATPTSQTESSDMATHPWTGEKVPRVPIKRSKYKATPPGTKPKKK